MTRTSAPPRARWVYNPHAGGTPIPEAVRSQITTRLQAHAKNRVPGQFDRLEVRIKGKFCYLDIHQDPGPVADDWVLPAWAGNREDFWQQSRNAPIQLCRLRYHGSLERWSFAFYSYASCSYEPACFSSGDLIGQAEDAFDLSASCYWS
jgi:hypothetical protein